MGGRKLLRQMPSLQEGYEKFRQKAHNFSRGMNGVFFQGTHYTVDICMVYML